MTKIYVPYYFRVLKKSGLQLMKKSEQLNDEEV